MALEVSLNEALSKKFRGTCKRRGDPAATLPDRTAHGGPPPKPLTAAQGVACRDTVNRGAAYADGRVFYNTLDGQTIALDAQTGEELWRTRLGDVDTGETITMAPLVVRDKVLVGNSGGEYDVGLDRRARCEQRQPRLARLQHRAGCQRADRERFRPFYPQHRGKDLGVASWPPGARRVGGSTAGASPACGSSSAPARPTSRAVSRPSATSGIAKCESVLAKILRARPSGTIIPYGHSWDTTPETRVQIGCHRLRASAGHLGRSRESRRHPLRRRRLVP